MPGFLKIKNFQKHKAAVWNISWSSYGDYFASCGADGIIYIWGLVSNLFFKNCKKKKNDFLYFSKWDILCKFESFLIFKSYRNIKWSNIYNEFYVGSFSGIVHSCKIAFFNNKNSVYFNKKNSLFGPTSEIKSCDLSPNNTFLSTTTRNRTIWFWEKSLNGFFSCFFILKQHESDVKCAKWYPRYKFFVSSTYEGMIRFFKKKNIYITYRGSINLCKGTIWLINFNKTGNYLFFCTNKGELGFLKKKSLDSKKKNIKCKFFSFITSISGVFFFAYSNITSFTIYSGNEENIEILETSKIWISEKDFQPSFGGIIGNFKINNQNSLKIPHIGNINCLIWHPKNDNILVSCSEDISICIWYYSQSKFE